MIGRGWLFPGPFPEAASLSIRVAAGAFDWHSLTDAYPGPVSILRDFSANCPIVGINVEIIPSEQVIHD